MTLSNSAAVKMGAAMRRVREAQGLRQAELAERLGCSQQYVSKIEQAKVPVTTRCVCRFARALGVPAKTVFEEARKKS